MVPWCPVTAVPGLSPCPAPSSGAAGAPLGSALQLWAPAAGAAGEGRARLAAPALRDTGLAQGWHTVLRLFLLRPLVPLQNT